jgi:hypothetical protein
MLYNFSSSQLMTFWQIKLEHLCIKTIFTGKVGAYPSGAPSIYQGYILKAQASNVRIDQNAPAYFARGPVTN